MPGIARAHHFVPQFLLANFTPSMKRDDKLWVTDLGTGRQWPSSPEKTGHQKDFYRVEHSSLKPDFFETVLSDIEGRAAPVATDVSNVLHYTR